MNDLSVRARRRGRKLYRRFLQFWLALSSYPNVHTSGDTFNNIEGFCIFIGYPRSGHTLVSSLIDAHPDAIIANELSVLRFVQLGCKKDQIYYLLLENSRKHAQSDRKWMGYSYTVPNQWQGRYRSLKVIGDKKGGGTVRLLHENTELLERLQDMIGLEIKYLHVIRNPYDNITTIAKKNGMRLEQSYKHYFSMCDTVVNVKKRIKNELIHDIKHESLIMDPRRCISDICQFLNLEVSEDYLNDCTSIINEDPRKSRFNMQWSLEMIELVQKRMDMYTFLDNYSYED